MILNRLMTYPWERQPLIVAIPFTTNPYPYVSYNLGTSFTQGTQMTVAYAGMRELAIGYETRNCVATLNSTSSTQTVYYSVTEGSSWVRPVVTNTSYSFGSGISPSGTAMFWSRSHIDEVFWYSYNSGTTVSTSAIALDQPRGMQTNYSGTSVIAVSSYVTQGKYTTNSCSSWTAFTTPWTCNNLFTAENLSKWYIARTGSTTFISYSTNSGGSWTSIAGIAYSDYYYVKGNASSGQYILAAGQSNIYRSGNSGGTWTRILTGSYVGLGAFSVSYTGKYMVIATNTAGQMLVSSDYGVNWTTVNVSGVTAVFAAIAIQD